MSSYVELTRADGWSKKFAADYATANERYKVLADAVSRAEQGDSVRFCGTFESTRHDRLDCSKLSYFGGFGRDASDLLMTSQHDADGPKKAGVAILLGNTVVEKCTLRNVPVNTGEDGALIGISGDGYDDVVLRDVKLVGHDWTFYHWPAAWKGGRVLIEDCDIEFARQGVTQAGGNATKSHWTIRRTNFVGNANNSKSRGATSDGDVNSGGVLAAVVFRAGLCEIEDCTFRLTGLAKPYDSKFGCPRIAAVTDHYYSKSSWSVRINIRNSRVLGITPGTAIEVNDIDQRFGSITWDNSEAIARATGGSGENGAMRVRLDKPV